METTSQEIIIIPFFCSDFRISGTERDHDQVRECDRVHSDLESTLGHGGSKEGQQPVN